MRLSLSLCACMNTIERVPLFAHEARSFELGHVTQPYSWVMGEGERDGERGRQIQRQSTHTRAETSE